MLHREVNSFLHDPGKKWKMSVLEVIVKQEKKMELVQAVFYFLYQNYSQMPTEE